MWLWIALLAVVLVFALLSNAVGRRRQVGYRAKHAGESSPGGSDAVDGRGGWGWGWGDGDGGGDGGE
jgi:hypothetical protein